VLAAGEPKPAAATAGAAVKETPKTAAAKQ
jgi:hypothetical protein